MTFPFLDRDPSVRLKESDLLVRWDAAPGTSLPAMNEATAEVVDELGAIPGVDQVAAHVGRAVHSDQIVNVNSGEIWLNINESADHDEAVASIERVLSSHDELAHRVTTYPEQRIADILSGRDRDVVVRVYGGNAEILEAKAEEIQSALSGIPGIERAAVETVPGEPTIEVEVDLQRAQRFGVKPGDVRRAAAILLAGLPVGNLFEEQKVFDVVVWGSPDIRRSTADVEQLLIDTPGGDHVRLSQVADVRVVENPTVLRHEAVSNYVDVSADIAGRDAGAVLADVDTAIAGVEFPLEHHAEVRGAATDSDASPSRVLGVAITAALAIFLLLQAAFTSWRLAILAFAALPVALVGGILAALIAGGTIGLGAFAGMLAVLGLTGRSVVLMIRHYQYLERDEGETFGDELVLRGTQERLIPTVVTALGTIVAFAPLLVMGDVAGMEIVRPMAIVMIGGLVASTLLVLFVLPPLYRMHGFVAKRDTVADELIFLPETPVEVEPVSGG